MSEEGFLTDIRTAELFFRICKLYRIQNRDARILVMRELVRRKKAKYLRDVASVLAGKKILVVKPKENQ
jgi:hypothetical protein